MYFIFLYIYKKYIIIYFIFYWLANTLKIQHIPIRACRFKCGIQPVECASCPIIPRGVELGQSIYIQQSRLALLF